MKKTLLTLTIAGIIGSTPLYANEYRELTAAGGEINWTKGKVSAEGYGTANDGANPKIASMLACRAATADAQRNLLETLQGTRITATTTVENFMLSSDIVKTSVEGVVKGASVVNRSVDADNICKITLSMDLGGKVASSIYQAEGTQSAWQIGNMEDWAKFAFNDWRFSLFNRAEAADMSSDWMQQIEQRLKALENGILQGKSDEAVAETAPTGLVIDARGSNFIPSLSPKVRELRGSIIYPDSRAKQSAIDTGQLVSLFATDVDFALRHPKVGERPLLLKALRTFGDTRTEIVLGKDSSDQLREMIAGTQLANAGVIIVLD